LLSIEVTLSNKVIRRGDMFGIYLDITNGFKENITVKRIKLTAPMGFINLTELEEMRRIKDELKRTQSLYEDAQQAEKKAKAEYSKVKLDLEKDKKDQIIAEQAQQAAKVKEGESFGTYKGKPVRADEVIPAMESHREDIDRTQQDVMTAQKKQEELRAKLKQIKKEIASSIFSNW
jgi:hypothetical protein